MKNNSVLADSCLVVRGSQRSSMCNIHSQRSIRLPNETLDILLGTGEEPLTEALRSTQERLLALGYLTATTRPGSAKGLDLGHQRTLQSPTTIISVSFEFIRSEGADAFLRELVENGQCKHLLVHLKPGDDEVRLHRALSYVGASYEHVSKNDNARGLRKIHDSSHKVIAVRRLTKRARLSQVFRFDYQTLLRNKHRYEGYGLVHIDAAGTVWPNACESHFWLGPYTDLSKQGILKNEKYQALLSVSKERRDVCQSCEFRLGCNWSITKRSDPHRLSSAPLGCPYDPFSDDNQNELF
jgi:hypothetical protein